MHLRHLYCLTADSWNLSQYEHRDIKHCDELHQQQIWGLVN